MLVSQHPFAAGITLSGFTAVSVNEKWEAAFIESTSGAIHKVIFVSIFNGPDALSAVIVGKFAIIGRLLRHRLAEHGWTASYRGARKVYRFGRNLARSFNTKAHPLNHQDISGGSRLDPSIHP